MGEFMGKAGNGRFVHRKPFSTQHISTSELSTEQTSANHGGEKE
jgi:hypothetical protein